ncbi:hypothetical protein VC892_16165 [Citrobacter portucalensis]|nr:hypothetical protein [Citrobacter portucalensis]MEB1081529.1 hypothetical protein [Citrobacter portucalensis]
MFIVNVLPDGGASALSGLQRFALAVLVGLISEAHQALLRRMAAQAPYPAYKGLYSQA